MTALFDEPPRITIDRSYIPTETEHAVGLLLGFTIEPVSELNHSAHLLGIVVLSNGSTMLLPQQAFVMDWRYEVENDRFVDLSAGKEEQDT
jgi:hypothetical protein